MSLKAVSATFVLILFAIGMYLVPGRVIGPKLDGVPGDFGDARLNNFFLEHGYQYFTGKIPAYWNAPFMYPDKQTLTYSDNLLGTLPLYILFRLLHLDRETSFQFWFITLCALNFISAFACFKKLKFNPFLSAMGAYVFAFSLPFIGKIGHAQLLAQFCIPWVFFYFIRFFNKFQPKDLSYAFLFLVWLFYCCMYLGFLTTLLVLLIVIIFGILKFKSLWKELVKVNYLKKLVLAIGIPFLIILPLIIPYYSRVLVSGYRDYKDVIPLLFSFRNFLMPAGEPWLWSKLMILNIDIPLYWEKTLWCGGLLFFFFTVYIIGRFIGRLYGRGISFVLILTVILASLIMVNWGAGFSFFKYVRHIPGFGSLKPIGRIILPMIFLIVWALLYYLRSIYIKYQLPVWTYALLAVLVIVDHGVSKASLIKYSKSESQLRIQSILDKIIAKKADPSQKILAVAYIPDTNENAVNIQIEAALAAQQLKIPSVNGYSSSCRGEFGDFWVHHDSVSLVKWLSANQKEIGKDGILLIK